MGVSIIIDSSSYYSSQPNTEIKDQRHAPDYGAGCYAITSPPSGAFLESEARIIGKQIVESEKTAELGKR